MSKVAVSSEALIELKNSLLNLSRELNEVADLMDADMNKLSGDWRDNKYEEFSEGFRPNIDKCREVAARYEAWCSKVLDPLIEHVVKMEKAPTSLDDAPGSGPVAGGGTAQNSGGGSTSPTSQTSEDATQQNAKRQQDIAALKAATEKMNQLQAVRDETSKRMFDSLSREHDPKKEGFWDKQFCQKQVDYFRKAIFENNPTGKPDGFGPAWKADTIKFLMDRQNEAANSFRNFKDDDKAKAQYSYQCFRMVGEIVGNLKGHDW